MQADWTFFYYCNAESDLFDNVITMMNNMSSMNFQSSNKINILLLVDRIKVTSEMETMRYYTEPELSWHQCVRFVMRSELKPVESAGTSLGDLDMGNIKNLTDFIQWGKENYAAKQYGLVIYGHGSGVSVGNLMTYRGASGFIKSMENSYQSAIKYIEKLVPDKQHSPVNDPNLSKWDKYRNSILSEKIFTPPFAFLLPEFNQTNGEEPICPDTGENGRKVKESLKAESKFFDRTNKAGRNRDIYVYDIRKGLESINFRPNLLIFDSCFMQCFETALELQQSTDFLIGSQGFHSRAVMGNQNFLQYLLHHTPVPTAVELANYIIHSVDSRLTTESIEAPTVMEMPETAPRIPDWFATLYAISCIDTSKFLQFNHRFNELVNFILDNLETTEKELLRARSMSLAYYINPCPDKFYIGTIDLLSLLKNLANYSEQPKLIQLSTLAASALEKTILASRCGSQMTAVNKPWYNPTGLGIFYPIDKTHDIDGATLIDAYWFNNQRKNYLFGSMSNWYKFILLLTEDWYTDPH